MSNLQELHDLLDGVRDGQHCKAVFRHDEYTYTIEGPVRVASVVTAIGTRVILHSGDINDVLAAFETTTTTEVTVTRDDGEDALREAIASLTDGQMVTAEWRMGDSWTRVHGRARSAGDDWHMDGGAMRMWLTSDSGSTHARLHSLTFTRDEVRRWERDGDES